jgi:hypothetical protein
MRQEVYRVAFDEAHAELSEILGKFEQLRLRKDRIEKLVEALKPLVSGNEPHTADRTSVSSDRQAAVAQHPSAPEPVAAVASPIPYPLQQAIEQSSDPLLRRESGAGLGSAARDIKEYSRLFNATLTHGN